MRREEYEAARLLSELDALGPGVEYGAGPEEEELDGLFEEAGPPDAQCSCRGERQAVSSGCALTTFRGSHFKGKTPVVDVAFLPALKRIHGYAVKHGIDVFVTSAFRQAGRSVSNAIVSPATHSNHLAGHAIDMNVVHQGIWYNSTKLKKSNRPRLPSAVRGFIDDIRADPGLRWGGDFRREDPVHIDDHLNRDMSAWNAQYAATQKARASGCG